MSKYIIKNCPSCYYIYCDKEYECNWKGNGITKPCKDRTDCVFKQIVEKCREHHTDLHFTPSEILALIDIQEVE